MKHYEIVRIKENGKIEIPIDYAYDLGIVEGAYFLIEVDTDLKELHAERVALPGKRLVEVELVVEDKPGVLAKISGLMGRHGANILFSESEELSAIGLAGVVAVIDVGKMSGTVDGLVEGLRSLPEVKEVTSRSLD